MNLFQRREGANATGLPGIMVALLALLTITLQAQNPCVTTWTADADFDQGQAINVNHDDVSDQLQLNTVTTPPPFIFVACSGRGTVVRIDVNTGTVLGEYWTAPGSMAKNPSRTTVDQYGNCWVANRNESSLSGGFNKGSVTRIAIVIGGTRVDAAKNPDPNGQYLMPPFLYSTAIDRDGDGLIKTSKGLTNILPWTNAGGADTDGGVTTAEDECIINFTRVLGTNVRTMAIDANNDLWTGGFGNGTHQKVDGVTGLPSATDVFNNSPGICGGYGGVIDGNGILWSSRYNVNLLRMDPATLTGTCISMSSSYGLAVDNNGYIWNSRYNLGVITKIHPSGSPTVTYSTHGSLSRGVAVTSDNNIWIANSGSNTVTRLSNSGALLATIGVGAYPTGVAVDANGKVWVTNYNSHSAMRIDPVTNAVDATVSLGGGAYPYNYSDMTGAVGLGSTSWQGYWSVVKNSGSAGTKWGTVSWTESLPTAATNIIVEARAAATQAGLSGLPFITVGNAVPLCGTGSELVGQYVEVRARLIGDPAATPPASPVLYDLTLELCDNEAPVPDLATLPDVTGECDATVTVTPTATDYCEGTIAGVTYDPLYYDAQGTYTVTWIYTDTKGNTSVQTQTVIVDDVTPPVLTLESDIELWPPDHKYVTVAVADMVAAVSDNCVTLTEADVDIFTVWSDEPENIHPGGDDGNTVDDIVIAGDCASVDLRSERIGDYGNGRVYTIVLSVTDGYDNVTTAAYKVSVIHDEDGFPAIDDGAAAGYTVNSTCSGLPKLAGRYSARTGDYQLEQNYPNPFNPVTTIGWYLSEAGHLSLTVFDLYGREVANVASGHHGAGRHQVSFDASGLASGLYLYVLKVNGITLQRTMNVLK